MTYIGRDSSRRPPLSNIICRDLSIRSVIDENSFFLIQDESERRHDPMSDSGWTMRYG